jgi:hypothetical protein
MIIAKSSLHVGYNTSLPIVWVGAGGTVNMKSRWDVEQIKMNAELTFSKPERCGFFLPQWKWSFFVSLDLLVVLLRSQGTIPFRQTHLLEKHILQPITHQEASKATEENRKNWNMGLSGSFPNTHTPIQ